MNLRTPLRYPLSILTMVVISMPFVAVVGSTALEYDLPQAQSTAKHWGGLYFTVGALCAGMSTLIVDRRMRPSSWWRATMLAWSTCIAAILLAEAITWGRTTPTSVLALCIPLTLSFFEIHRRDVLASRLAFASTFVVVVVISNILALLGVLRDAPWAATRIPVLYEITSDPYLFARWSHPFGDANLLGILAVASIVLVSRWRRSALGKLLVSACVLIVIGSQSRTALMLLLIVFVMYLESCGRKKDIGRTWRLLTWAIVVASIVVIVMSDPSLNGRLPRMWNGIQGTDNPAPFEAERSVSHSLLLEPIALYGLWILVPLVVFVGLLYVGWRRTPGPSLPWLSALLLVTLFAASLNYFQHLFHFGQISLLMLMVVMNIDRLTRSAKLDNSRSASEAK